MGWSPPRVHVLMLCCPEFTVVLQYKKNAYVANSMPDVRDTVYYVVQDDL